MPEQNKTLPKAVKRELLHRRTIVCEGFIRDDGLFDIEGQMIDVKDYDFKNTHRGLIEAGEPLHDMRIRLTLDNDLEVKDIVAATAYSPYRQCSDIAPAYKKLIGEKIQSGWSRKIKQTFRRELGCTHLSELLITMATVALQTILGSANSKKMMKLQAPLKTSSDQIDQTKSSKISFAIGGCYALRADGLVASELLLKPSPKDKD
ncbi:MAG: DUF2889 domain-containing protein [Pseudomonadota bacterium]